MIRRVPEYFPNLLLRLCIKEIFNDIVIAIPPQHSFKGMCINVVVIIRFYAVHFFSADFFAYNIIHNSTAVTESNVRLRHWDIGSHIFKPWWCSVSIHVVCRHRWAIITLTHNMFNGSTTPYRFIIGIKKFRQSVSIGLYSPLIRMRIIGFDAFYTYSSYGMKIVIIAFRTIIVTKCPTISFVHEIGLYPLRIDNAG